MRHFETTTTPVIMGALGMTKKKQINIRYLAVPTNIKWKNTHPKETEKTLIRRIHIIFTFTHPRS